MPCTRSTDDELAAPMDYSSSDSDPDYRESSADEDEEIPRSMGRDRAEWVMLNQEEIAEFYDQFKQIGRQLFGNCFYQTGGITAFGHFLYRHTTPGAN